MKKWFVIILVVFSLSMLYLSCSTPPAPPGYEKETSKEGDVDYISEPIHEGKDTVIKGYASPVNRITDDARESEDEWQSDINDDMGLDK